MARVLADTGMKVLIIDTDSQGSVASILNLKPENYLYNFLVNNQAFRDCIVEAIPNVHVMCSNRRTVEAEAVFMGVTGREMAFDNVFPLEDHLYDVVLLDVAPSITLDRKSTRLNSSHPSISYAVFCLKKKKNNTTT